MRIEIKASGIEPVKQLLLKLSSKRAAQAYANALNDTGFQIRKAMQAEMAAVFDRPTGYILRAPRVIKAKADKLTVTIEPAYMGGKGVDPQKILNAQTWGGRRRDKRSEVALRRVGILPVGYQTALPKTPLAGTEDGNGNLKGSFLVQLLSYFQAFSEQGYKANMTDRRKKTIHRGTKKVSGRRYFVAYGGLRSGGTSHLAAGIWAASGTHGVDIRPVLMFVKAGAYQPRFLMENVAKRADAEAYLGKRLRYQIRKAAGV